MLADVHAKFGGRPPRSRRAARPPSWRRRRDRTPRIRAAHQSRSTTSEGLRGCPPDVGCTPDLIFPGARPSGAPVRTRHRTRRAASRDPKPYAMVGKCTDRDRLAYVAHALTESSRGLASAKWPFLVRPPQMREIISYQLPDVVGQDRRGPPLHGRSTFEEPAAPVERLDLPCPPVCNVVHSILWRTFREGRREKTILFSPSRNYDGAARRRPDSDRTAPARGPPVMRARP